MSSLKLKVSQKGGNYEGQVSGLPGLAPAKLQKSDGTTKFATRSACVQAANATAKKLGCTITENQPVKQAAKKSAAKAKTKKSPTITTPTWLKS